MLLSDKSIVYLHTLQNNHNESSNNLSPYQVITILLTISIMLYISVTFNLLKKDMATHSSIFAWKIPMVTGAWWETATGSQRVRYEFVVVQSVMSHYL